MSVSLKEAIGLIALGGIAGASIRYAVGAVGGEGLLVTVLINIAGCFLLGLMLFGALEHHALADRLRMVLGTGFAASLTTYSTFIADILQSEPIVAAIYLIASYLGGIVAILLSRVVVGNVTYVLLENEQ